MITRKSFFIRWLLISDEKQLQEPGRSVIDIEHIQSGNNRRVSSLEEASSWMREIDADSVEEKRKIEKQ